MINEWVLKEIEAVAKWIDDTKYKGQVVIEINCHDGSINDCKWKPTFRIEKPISK
jgi:hypothetical protein